MKQLLSEEHEKILWYIAVGISLGFLLGQVFAYYEYWRFEECQKTPQYFCINPFNSNDIRAHLSFNISIAGNPKEAKTP